MRDLVAGTGQTNPPTAIYARERQDDAPHEPVKPGGRPREPLPLLTARDGRVPAATTYPAARTAIDQRTRGPRGSFHRCSISTARPGLPRAHRARTSCARAGPRSRKDPSARPEPSRSSSRARRGRGARPRLGRRRQQLAQRVLHTPTENPDVERAAMVAGKPKPRPAVARENDGHAHPHASRRDRRDRSRWARGGERGRSRLPRAAKGDPEQRNTVASSTPRGATRTRARGCRRAPLLSLCSESSI